MHLRPIAKDVYQLALMPRSGINCYIAEGMLMDAGIRSSYPAIARALQQLPVHVHLLTHAHPDHQGSTAQVCTNFGIPLGCHPLETDRAESGRAILGYPQEENIIARLQQKYWSGEGQNVSQLLRENDRVGDFRVVETPGHSSGHISFFREADGVLILGDVATNMNLLTTVRGLHLPPGMFTADREENIRSLKKLAELHPRVIGFGHGPVLYNTDKLFERFVSGL